jgi:hypothetical protein
MAEELKLLKTASAEDRTRALDTEEPLREIRVFANALHCIGVTSWDEMPSCSEERRDEAIQWLSLLIHRRVVEVERLILGD